MTLVMKGVTINDNNICAIGGHVSISFILEDETTNENALKMDR